MLRASLYRRVVLIAVGAAALSSAILGTAGYYVSRASLEAEQARALSEVEDRLSLVERFASLAEEEMLGRGRRALLELSARYAGGRGLVGLSRARLKDIASSLDVDEIYLIGPEDTVLALPSRGLLPPRPCLREEIQRPRLRRVHSPRGLILPRRAELGRHQVLRPHRVLEQGLLVPPQCGSPAEPRRSPRRGGLLQGRGGEKGGLPPPPLQARPA